LPLGEKCLAALLALCLPGALAPFFETQSAGSAVELDAERFGDRFTFGE